MAVRGYRDRVALVTGAASGIGRALAEELALAGAVVIASDLDACGVRAVAEPIGAESHRLDVADAEAFQALVDGVVARHGRLDLLFNNAGIGLAGEVRDTTLADWRRQIDVNLGGVVHGVAAAYPVMLRQGAGQIVNVASGAGLLPRPGMTAYAAAKHAVVGLSTSLRAEAASLGVRVNVVCPGYVGTSILKNSTYRALDGQAMQDQIAKLPVRPLSAEACARRILRGARRNRAIITTNALTRLEWLLYRLLPGLGIQLGQWRGRKMQNHRVDAPALEAAA